MLRAASMAAWRITVLQKASCVCVADDFQIRYGVNYVPKAVPSFMRGSLFYYRFRMANHEKEALLSLIAPFALAYMPTVHPVKPPADSVL